jgi:hypothetical protein
MASRTVAIEVVPKGFKIDLSEEIRARVDAYRVCLERIAQAAEQYLDTEHRDEARDLELRRNLGEAATDAALLLYPSGEVAE